MRRIVRWPARLAGAAALFAPALRAQAPGDTTRLAPVVVTATRVAVPAADVPAAVTVLDGAALRARGLRTVAQALRLVPGASVVQAGSWGGQTSLFLRGGENTYVKVLVDGVPQNDPGGTYDFSRLTLDDVDRIEVVRGPSSVLYGSDAVTGVVQIFTRDGRGRLHADLGVDGGTYGTADGRIALGAGSARAGLELAFAHHATDGTYAFNSAFRNDVASGRVRFAPDGRTETALSWRYGDDRYDFPTDYIGNPVYRTQHQTERGPSIGFAGQRRLASWLDFAASAGWHRDDYDYVADTSQGGAASDSRTSRLDAGMRLNAAPSGSQVVTFGADVERETQVSADLDAARRNGAVYAQYIAGVGRALSATAGVRLDDNQRFGSFATWRAGASWLVAAATRLRASLGTGFREPSLFENYSTSPFARGNPGLRPERSFSWEAGVEQSVGPAVLRMTYFDQRFRGLIDYSSAPLGADSSNYFNVPAATSRGVETELAAAIGAGVRADVAYTYLDARATAAGFDTGPDATFAPGRPLLRRPHDQLSATVSIARGRAGASLTTAYTGRRDDLDFSTFPAARVSLPPVTRVDATADWTLRRGAGGDPAVTLTLRAQNLFDAYYQEIRNFPAPRRTILFGATIHLGS